VNQTGGSPLAPRASVASGFQLLLLRVSLLPFVVTLGALVWLAYLEANPTPPPWVAGFGRWWLILIPVSWGFSLWWGWRGVQQLTRAFEGLAEGQATVPGEFLGLSEHLLFLQASLQERARAQSGYLQSVQRMDMQRRLLQSLAQEGMGEAELEGWVESLRQGLEPGLRPKELSIWVQDGADFLWMAGNPVANVKRRSFDGLTPCWIETTSAGEHHFFLKVDPGLELDSGNGIVMVLELILESGGEKLGETRERLLSCLPLLSVSWANWSLYRELTARIRMNHSVIESLEDGVLVADRKGRIVSANRAALRLTGQATLASQSLEKWVPLPDGTSWEEGIARKRLVPLFETQLKRTGQSPIDIRVLNSLAHDKGTPGAGLAVTVVLRDVTKQKELENLRSDFTATLSHELRTPLTSMKGYLQTLMHRKARQFDMDKIQSIVGVVNGQADQLQRLIQELLEAAKMRSQDLEIRPRPVELVGLMRDCLQDNPTAKVVQTVVTEGRCWSLCDPERIQSVLEHLLSNAQKYSLPGGKVELGCETLDSQQVRVWVRDEGVGIPEEQQEKIFEMYHRLDTGNQRTHYGVGVGLYIARKVVEGHGGQIAVESAPGCGATFSFTLPLGPAESADSAGPGLPESLDEIKKN